MSDLKTIAELAKDSDLSAARVNALLKDVQPEAVLGRTKGFHPDSLKSALLNKLEEELKYLGVYNAAVDSLTGYGFEG